MRLIRNFLIAAAIFLIPGIASAGGHLVVKESPHSVSATLDKLETVMKKKGITIFLRIDHAAAAKKIGIDMPPNQVLIFGNPKLGSPLIQSGPTIGVDLPLKAVAWKGADGKVRIAYTKPSVLAQRYGITNRPKVFKKITGALDKLTNAAIKP